MKIKKPLIIVAGVMLVLAVFFAVRLYQPGMSVNDIIKKYSWKFPEDELDKALLSNGRMNKNSCAALDRAIESFDAGSREALNLAVYALMRTGQGYPEETARQHLTDQIDAMDSSKYYNDSTIKTLLQAAPWAMEKVFDKFRESDDYAAGSMLKLIAENSGDLPLEDRVKWAAAIKNSQFTGADFLSASLTDADLPELRALLTGPAQPEQLNLCAQALADQLNQPEDIIPILYHLRRQGYSLGELFPDGIRLSMDLSGLNQLRELPEPDGSLPAGSKYLIISRREHDVQGEALKKKPDPGYSCNDRNDPSVFDVRVETAWTDQISPDQLPASYEECQWLAVMDVRYIYEDCITTLSDYATGKKEQGENFYPVYSRLERLLLVERDGLAPRYLIGSLSADADREQEVIRWTNLGTGASVSVYTVAPRVPDEEWENEQIRQLLDRQ